MNIGKETEQIEFKKSTSEKKEAMDDVCAILNKHCGGILYFGVKNNGDVVGQQISDSSLNDVGTFFKNAIKPMVFPIIREENMDGKTVIKVQFSGTERPYSSYGRYYKRVFDRSEEMTPEELKSMMLSFDYSSSWENKTTKYGLDSVDSDALKDFYNQSVSCGRLEPLKLYDEKSLLQGLGLFENEKLTNAGFYLFSKVNPIVLKTAVYVTDEKISFSDINRFSGNIYSLIRKGVAYIKEHINWRVEQGSGSERIEVPEIPIVAIREIVVNSFAHADYRSETENEIDITPTRVEIYNHGSLPLNVTPLDYVANRKRSIPRNKVILNVLFKSKDVENFGGGFRKTYEVCKKQNIKVEYKNDESGFEFAFLRNRVTDNVTANVTDNVSKLKRNGLSSLDSKVLYEIEENPAITRVLLAKKLKKAVRTIQRSINTLKENKIISRIGTDKKGFWDINSEK